INSEYIGPASMIRNAKTERAISISMSVKPRLTRSRSPWWPDSTTAAIPSRRPACRVARPPRDGNRAGLGIGAVDGVHESGHALGRRASVGGDRVAVGRYIGHARDLE